MGIHNRHAEAMGDLDFKAGAFRVFPARQQRYHSAQAQARQVVGHVVGPLGIAAGHWIRHGFEFTAIGELADIAWPVERAIDDFHGPLSLSDWPPWRPFR
ncbi:hypothetical protein D3C72_2265910 [compost metagenome]